MRAFSAQAMCGGGRRPKGRNCFGTPGALQSSTIAAFRPDPAQRHAIPGTAVLVPAPGVVGMPRTEGQPVLRPKGDWLG